MSADTPVESPFKQPKAVWAVAFACTISFMGIGLVDPILPALASSLHGTPSQISLLFTSYLLVTSIAMLGVNFVSSRIGSKYTLVTGLAIIVVCAAAAGAVNSIAGIVWFRAGWGLGNALFIATSLSVIVASASGGFAGAIILYETALGLGIAVGPLLGGVLGGISWRGPFFGVAALMAIALVATITMVRPTPKPAEKTPLSAPIMALRHRGLLMMGLVALLYNWGFFTMLGYAPYPMKLNAHELGFVFFGWGLLVAAFAIWVAPRLQRRFGTVKVLLINLVCLGASLLVIALNVHNPTAIIITVIVTGAFMGINNTLTTQGVMMVSPVDRSVASAAYGFVRFLGGGLAPYVAGKIADAHGPAMSFQLGAFAFVLAVPFLLVGKKDIDAAEHESSEPELVDQSAGTCPVEHIAGELDGGARPVLVAVGSGPHRERVVEQAIARAVQEHAPLELLHVFDTEVIGDAAIAPLSRDEAVAMVRDELDRHSEVSVPMRAVLLSSVGDLGAVGRAIGEHAAAIDARAVVLHRSPRGTQVAEGMNDGASQAAGYSLVLVGDEAVSGPVLTPASSSDPDSPRITRMGGRS